MKLSLILIASIASSVAAASELPATTSSEPSSISSDTSKDADSNHIHDHSMSHSTSNSSESMLPSPASMNGGGHHHNRKSILEDPDLEPQQRAYWEQYDPTTFLSAPGPKKAFLYLHIVLNVVSWAFVYPVSLALSVAKSPFYLLVQTIHFALVLVALFCLAVYGVSAPSLYPGNSYAKMSVAMLFISVIHWVAAVIAALANWAIASRGSPMDGAEYVLANLNSSARPARGAFIRPSQDSGHGIGSPQVDDFSDMEDDEDDSGEQHTLYPTPSPSTSFETTTRGQNKLIARIMANKKVYATVSKLGSVARVIYSIINRPLFVVGIAYLMIGTATLFRLGMGHKVFNILAHFIKGSVFLFYGVLTLMRYLGAFADRGMAWNVAPGSPLDPSHTLKSKRSRILLETSASSGRRRFLVSMLRLPTMEFVECALIFIYGCTNVFMEHLGNTTGVWSHKDLQHVSIAFMYFGGGLCGLLVESGSVRRLINRAVSTSNNDHDDDLASGMLGSISINPFPAFIVFWTGVLMSQHEQALPLSTAIHIQWGYLLLSAAVFRGLTYLLVFLNPPKSTVPSRPLTELLTSFCLICGGLVFIQSNGQTVEAMLYRSLDGMFTLNVTVGVTSLIMAWIMVVMTIKAWATKRASRLSLDDLRA